MFSLTSSSASWFRLVLIVCCIVATTSYNIDRRPFADRNQRAVTEWRFRRNFLLPMQYYFNYASHDHSAAEDDSDGGAMDADDETGTYGKKGLAHVVEERMT